MKKRRLSWLLVCAMILNLVLFSKVSADSKGVNVSPSVTNNSVELIEEKNILISTVPDNIKNLVSDLKADMIIMGSESEGEAELNALRTINSKTGEGTITVHSIPVKYVDDAGKIQFIDTSMKPITEVERMQKGFVYRNAANSFLVEFGNTALKGINFNNAFTLEAKPNTIQSNRTVPEQKKTEKGHGKIVYSGVFGPDTKVEYINTERGLKENIILDKYTNQNRFDFIFQSNTHIPILTNDGKNILIADKDNLDKVEYCFLSLYAYDSYDPVVNSKLDSVFRHMNEDLYYNLMDNGNGVYTITVVVPEEYLTHPDIVYPVTIDPSITTVSGNSNTQDTFTDAGNPNSCSNGSLDYIRFGKVNGYKNCGYYRLNTLPVLPSGATITSAYLKFTFRSGQTTPPATSGIKFRTIQVSQYQWDEATITWNNQPYGASGLVSPITYNGSNLDYANANITSTVQSWYNGSPNYGVAFTYSNEDYNDYNSVVSSEGEAHRAPTMTINYQVQEEPQTNTTGLVSGKSYYIKNVFFGKYIDVTNNYDDLYTPVIGYDYSGAVNQQWKLVNCGVNKYNLVDIGSSTGKVLNVSGSSIDIFTDNGSDCQKFTITRQETPLYGRSGQYYIQYNGKYLTLSTDQRTLTLQNSPENYNGRSLWSFEMVSKGDADIYNFSEFAPHLTINEENYRTKMLSMGYTPYYLVNISRDTAFNYLKNDSIWFHTGHGGEGYVCFNDSDISATQIDALPSNELAGLRCFITLGCSSGATDERGNNIIDSVYDKGAQFALGFTHTQYTPIAETWLVRFFEHSSAGYNIKSSLQYADIVANVPYFGTGMKYYIGDDEQMLRR